MQRDICINEISGFDLTTTEADTDWMVFGRLQKEGKMKEATKMENSAVQTFTREEVDAVFNKYNNTKQGEQQ